MKKKKKEEETSLISLSHCDGSCKSKYCRYKYKNRLSRGVTDERPKYKVPEYVICFPKGSAPTVVSKS